jgi:hypothetical protein
VRAIRISRWGGSEVLELVDDVPVPEPAPHEVLVRVSRAGINYADTQAADNSYLASYELPLTPGAEVVVGFWLAHCFGLPAVGGAARARGSAGPPHDRQAAPGPRVLKS